MEMGEHYTMNHPGTIIEPLRTIPLMIVEPPKPSLNDFHTMYPSPRVQPYVLVDEKTKEVIKQPSMAKLLMPKVSRVKA